MGFTRNDSLNWKVGCKKSRSLFTILPDRTLRSTLSKYAIPSKVAPQQSLGLLHIFVKTKIQCIIYFLTLRFPHQSSKF
jgi:hypothetical protein